MQLFAPLVFTVATLCATNSASADDCDFGYDNAQDCLAAHSSCARVQTETTLANFIRQFVSFQTLEDIARANDIRIECLLGGEIVLTPGTYFNTQAEE